MTARKGNAVVAQGGGPTAVINSSLNGVVLSLSQSLHPSSKILGARGGILGVFQQRWFDLRQPDQATWKRISASPGAALGSCRKKLTLAEADSAVEILRKEEVRYIFCIGGNDTMDTTLKLVSAAETLGYELHAVGIPKTIDNDLAETDHCPGFGSAARYIAQSTVDLGIDIRSLPTPVSIIEVMGRNAGWLTAATMLAKESDDDAPHLIYVPENAMAVDEFLTDVADVYQRHGWVVVAVSEGLKNESGDPFCVSHDPVSQDDFGHALPGDVAASLARLVSAKLGIRARSEKPGICGRASALLASTVDRREAEQVASFAAEKALSGQTGFMAAIQRDSDHPYSVSYKTVPLSEVANVERLLPAEYVTPNRNGINKEFVSYVEPLIGEPLHRHARLEP